MIIDLGEYLVVTRTAKCIVSETLYYTLFLKRRFELVFKLTTIQPSSVESEKAFSFGMGFCAPKIDRYWHFQQSISCSSYASLLQYEVK